ncbi:hypothetical protein PHYSODRAFT_297581 [Phytophthora sojae]|uniref:Histone-lysine N-methyltransferase, H3 lysine-79 specific n=1 Tax=Phytophthora sojae (strain P6497) TaxID=1094619 RepID=G4YYV5_PHYSP|nr:hypothetical protein PHYSODRAFT_297581 [Phytophthora sojae]EGZ26247.1 hypothetical protein PHYSODRAFT_297581 [Phytophthora sojae]|eukprot:XP_009521535.1 hypothetical protein PHYSODRAFT_297581 [Phytophthora sojae]
MSDFSDNQDAVLVRLVRPYLQQQQTIQWDTVVKRMRVQTKSKQALWERLKTLKQTHGKLLDRFPASYFRTHSAWQPTLRCPPQPITKGIISAQPRTRPSRQAHVITEAVFRGVSQRDVRQLPGKPHFNAGEIASGGVTMLLKVLNIGAGATFGDIGCGIGNVLVQVALESSVKACIGVEVREELVAAAHSALLSNSTKYPELLRVSIYQVDICNLAEGVYRALSDCSDVLVKNIVFAEEANLALEQFLCMSTVASQVVLGRKMCPRHRNSCGHVFCLLWDLVQPVQLEVEWASISHEFYLYRRAQLASF